MENDSQIAVCDAKVLCYFRRHGPAPTADAKKALAADAKKALAAVFQLLDQPVRKPSHFSTSLSFSPEGQVKHK